MSGDWERSFDEGGRGIAQRAIVARSPPTAASVCGYLHGLVDDHSRLAYVELHSREDTEVAAWVRERSLAFFAELGPAPPWRS